MAASEITVSSAKLYYGTDAEINALTGTKGDVGFATDTGKEYTNTDGGTTWEITRVNVSGAACVALPENTLGMVSIGEIDNSTAGLAAGVVIPFAQGLLGITIKVIPLVPTFDKTTGVYTAPSTVTHMIVAFNNTAFNDISIAGLRHLIPMGDERTFTFSGSPLPSQVTIGTATAGATTVESAANESYTTYIAAHN